MRFSILAIIALSACTSIVPSTVMRLNGLSPSTADPAGFAVDLTLPAGIDVQPGTARLLYSVARADTGQTRSGSYTLERDGSVFRIAPDDLAGLRALQATTRLWQVQNRDATDGSLGLTVAFCKNDPAPAADGRVSVGLRLEEGGAFLPLVRNGPLSAVASADQISEMGLCP